MRLALEDQVKQTPSPAAGVDAGGAGQVCLPLGVARAGTWPWHTVPVTLGTQVC